MLKRTGIVAMIVLFQLVAIGCKNKQQKANDFVNAYNLAAPMVTNNVISGTSAKLLPNSDIEIRFETNMEFSEANQQMFGQLLPNVMTNVFAKDRSAADLLDEGVKFNVAFYADNGRELNTLVVDKQKLEELLKPNPNDKKTASIGANSNLSPELQEMLVMMNKSLPMENKAEGTKIMKIDIDNNNELVYTVEVQDSLSSLLKEEGAKSIMKESIMRSSNYRMLVNGVKRFGVTKIKYLYQDSKGNKITEVNIDANRDR